MNTESQKVVEISHAHVADSGFVEPASTSKIFVKRFDRVSDERWNEMHKWCIENLYHGGHYEPNWNMVWPSFYFTDEQEYTLFLLKWS
jgi:hypothetical protein